MKLLLTLASVVLTGAFVMADDPATTKKAEKGEKASCLDGTWKVLSAEKNGEAVPDAKDMTVTVRDNIITCNCSKTGSTMKIEFTGSGKARVTATDGKGDGKGEAKEATFILTNDYLAVCMRDEKSAYGPDGKLRDPVKDAMYQPSTKGQSTVVLKRADSK